MKNIILIPYRDRKKHLEYFLQNTAHKLKEKIDNLEILIVEQVKGKLFNRGKILNVGYHYYNNLSYNYITQDVDINPIHNDVFDLYKKDPGDKIIGIYTSWVDTLGGIIKFKGNTFKKVNGFINDYWGWGVEDKNLQNRVEFFKIKIKKNFFNNKHEYNKNFFKIFNDIDDRLRINLCSKTSFEYNRFKKIKNKLNCIMCSGLSNLKYEIIKEENINDFIKKIIVNI